MDCFWPRCSDHKRCEAHGSCVAKAQAGGAAWPGHGRLVYDKARRTIVAQQTTEHPLAKFGYRRPPHWLWGRSRRAYMIVGAVMDMWLILRGKLTLHRAWQAGHDNGHMAEVIRRMNGGR